MENVEQSQQPQQPNAAASKMRKAWFDYVRKTRARMSRGQKVKCTHREAMKAASVGWPVEKAKLVRKIAREAKRQAKK